MKVLWVNPWFGNYRLPVYEEMNRLLGGNFHLIAGTVEMDKSLLERLPRALGKNCHVMWSHRVLVLGKNKSNMANATIRVPYVRGLYRTIRRVRPDLVIADGFFQWTPITLLYCLTHRVPLVIDYERTEHVERHSPRWRTLYRRLVDRFVAGYVINGSLTRRYLTHVLRVAGNKPMVEGAMAADAYGLEQRAAAVPTDEAKALRRSLCPDEGRLYLFVGQMVKRKGVNELLTAWGEHSRRYPADRLVMIGTGVLERAVEQVASYVPSVLPQGAVPYARMHLYYRVADVFVMPTLEDNWSLVVPEAMACGLPVLCSIYNGCYPELIKEGVNGFTFDPLNHAQTVQALERIRTCDLQAMGRASREIQRDFTPDKAARRIVECCQKVMEKRKPQKTKRQEENNK